MEPTFQAEVHRQATEEDAAVDDGKENNPDRTVPVGFRFRPTDQELVSDYLFKEALSQPLPANLIRQIDEVAIREHHPSKLVTGSDEKEMFFFTQMSRNLYEKEVICVGGSAGLWRSNKDEIKIEDLEGRCIGSKRSMTFFQGKPPCLSRTRWLMEVYWLNDDELQAANLQTGSQYDLPRERYTHWKNFQGKSPCLSRTQWVMEVYWLNDDKLQATNLKAKEVMLVRIRYISIDSQV